MSSSRNYDSAPAYRGEHDLPENNNTFLKSKRRPDIVFSYSKLLKPSTHGNSDDGASDAGLSDYDTRITKKRSSSGKRRGSAVTNTTISTSFASDMSSSAGRSFSGYILEQERVPEDKSDDDVRHRHNSIDSSYASQSFSSKRRGLDYQSDVNNNERFSSVYQDDRKIRQAKDHRSRREPRSRVERQDYYQKEFFDQVSYKLAECSETNRMRQKGRRKHSAKSNDLDNYDQRERKYRSRSPEDLRSPYKTPGRQSSRHVNSVKRRSESRSATPDRSRSSSPAARRGRHRRSRTSKSRYSSRENSPYRRHESSSERDLETVYQRRRRSRNHDTVDSPSPKHSRRRHNKSPRDEKPRRSKASWSKRGSRDDEKSISRHRSDSSYFGQRDQSTRSSRCRSRRSETYYSPQRRDSSEHFYSNERRSRGMSNSPTHSGNNSPSYHSRRSPKATLKLSEWLPECRLENIEARGGKRDFGKWFTVLPPHVQVDKDVRTDRGVFKKDNFQSSQALDKYLGLKNSRSPVDRRNSSSRSPG